MKLSDLSITFHTHDVVSCKEFYEKYFNAKTTFDCGWYVTIQFDGTKPLFLSFMKPQDSSDHVSNGGTTLNLGVDDVDATYDAIKKTGIPIADEIEDHEWGDRSFAVIDPIGNKLYIYSEREITGQYKDYLK